MSPSSLAIFFLLRLNLHRLGGARVGTEAVDDLDDPPIRVVTDDWHRPDPCRRRLRHLDPSAFRHIARLRHDDGRSLGTAMPLKERVGVASFAPHSGRQEGRGPSRASHAARAVDGDGAPAIPGVYLVLSLFSVSDDLDRAVTRQ